MKKQRNMQSHFEKHPRTKTENENKKETKEILDKKTEKERKTKKENKESACQGTERSQKKDFFEELLDSDWKKEALEAEFEDWREQKIKELERKIKSLRCRMQVLEKSPTSASKEILQRHQKKLNAMLKELESLNPKQTDLFSEEDVD